MNKVNDYSRNFLYFKPEDRGFDNGREPLGFISFDVRDGKGKLTAFIENLSESDKFEYKLYLISSTEARTTPVFVTKIKLVNSKAQINWNFDASNVGGSRLSLEEYNVAAVIVEYADRNSSVISPLAAYKGAKTEWKSRLKDVLYQKRTEVMGKYDSNEQKPEYDETLGQKEKARPAERIYKAETDGMSKQTHIFGQTDQTAYIAATPSDQAQIVEKAGKTEHTEESQTGGMTRGNTIYSNPNNNLSGNYNSNPHNVHNSNLNSNLSNNLNNNFNNNPNNIPNSNINYNPNISLNSNPNNNAALQQDTMLCSNCKYADNKKENSKKTRKNNDKFTYTFDKYLERCDPFNSGRKDYVWWRAGSTYYLNTILYWINVRTPIMLSPAVFNAASKHGHLIVGLYTDMGTNEKHLVFGIPGKYGTEIKPFGELGRWAQADISKPEYNAFGYWLIYMDPYTARVIE